MAMFELKVTLRIESDSLSDAISRVENRLKQTNTVVLECIKHIEFREITGRLVPARALGKVTRTGHKELQ